MSTPRPTQRSHRPAYYFLGRSAMRWQVALDTPRKMRARGVEKDLV